MNWPRRPPVLSRPFNVAKCAAIRFEVKGAVHRVIDGGCGWRRWDGEIRRGGRSGLAVAPAQTGRRGAVGLDVDIEAQSRGRRSRGVVLNGQRQALLLLSGSRPHLDRQRVHCWNLFHALRSPLQSPLVLVCRALPVDGKRKDGIDGQVAVRDRAVEGLGTLLGNEGLLRRRLEHA